MSVTPIDVPEVSCPATILPTKAALTNTFGGLASIPSQLYAAGVSASYITPIRTYLDSVNTALGSFPVSASSPIFGDLSIPEIEWERRITALVSEYHLYVQAKFLEIIDSVLSVSFEIPVFGLDVDIVSLFSDSDYRASLRSTVADNVSTYFAALPTPYKLFDGTFGLESAAMKAQEVWSNMMMILNQGALSVLHTTLGSLVSTFDSIWDTFSFPSLPSLTDLNVESVVGSLVSAFTSSSTATYASLITSLQSVTLAGTTMAGMLGGTITEHVVSAERTIHRMIEGARDFGQSYPKSLIVGWMDTVSDFLSAIGLSSIVSWISFDFCDFLGLVGMPTSISLTNDYVNVV